LTVQSNFPSIPQILISSPPNTRSLSLNFFLLPSSLLTGNFGSLIPAGAAESNAFPVLLPLKVFVWWLGLGIGWRKEGKEAEDSGPQFNTIITHYILTRSSIPPFATLPNQSIRSSESFSAKKKSPPRWPDPGPHHHTRGCGGRIDFVKLDILPQPPASNPLTIPPPQDEQHVSATGVSLALRHPHRPLSPRHDANISSQSAILLQFEHRLKFECW